MKSSLAFGILLSAVAMAVSSLAWLLGHEIPLFRPGIAFLVFVSAMLIQLIVADYASKTRVVALRIAPMDAPASPSRRWQVRLKTRAVRLPLRNRF